MAINKKLIHFNKKTDFESEVAKGNILNYSICFIADTKEIYTHGNYYSQVSEAPTDGQKYIRVNGAWYVLSDSSSSTSGLMSAIDKTKLDGIDIATADSIGLVKGGTTTADTKTYGVDIAADGAMTVAVPWEDTEALTNEEIAAAIAAAGV